MRQFRSTAILRSVQPRAYPGKETPGRLSAPNLLPSTTPPTILGARVERPPPLNTSGNFLESKDRARLRPRCLGSPAVNWNSRVSPATIKSESGSREGEEEEEEEARPGSMLPTHINARFSFQLVLAMFSSHLSFFPFAFFTWTTQRRPRNERSCRCSLSKGLRQVIRSKDVRVLRACYRFTKIKKKTMAVHKTQPSPKTFPFDTHQSASLRYLYHSTPRKPASRHLHFSGALLFLVT